MGRVSRRGGSEERVGVLGPLLRDSDFIDLQSRIFKACQGILIHV